MYSLQCCIAFVGPPERWVVILHSQRDGRTVDESSMTEERKIVTAVIVTYQSRETIGNTLDELLPAWDQGFCDCVVVDNASSDGTADFVRESYPWVRVVASAENLGFGRGCNLGFESVDTPYVLMLNPDACIDASALRILVEFMEARPRVGIAAPATVAGNGECQDAGLVLTPLGLVRAMLGLGGSHPDKKSISPGAAPFRTTWVCGAIMLIRSELFRKLRGFDPRFFLYFEETDLCLRAAAAGQELWVVGAATATHLVGASAQKTGAKLSMGSTGNIVEHYYPSRFYYLQKHFGWFPAIGAEAVAAAVECLRGVRAALTGNMATARRYLFGRPFFKLPVKGRS